MKNSQDRIRVPRFYFNHSRMYGSKIVAFGVNANQANPTYDAVVLDTIACRILNKTILLEHKTLNTCFKLDETHTTIATFSPNGDFAAIGVKPLLLFVEITPDLEIKLIDSRKTNSFSLVGNSNYQRNYSKPPFFTFGKWNKKEVLIHLTPKEMEYNDKTQNMSVINIHETGDMKEPIATQVIPEIAHTAGNLFAWSEPLQALVFYSKYSGTIQVYKEKNNTFALEKKYNFSMGDYPICEIHPSPTDPVVIVMSTKGEIQQLDLVNYKPSSHFHANEYRGNGLYWHSSGKEFFETASGVVLQFDHLGRTSNNENYKHDVSTASIGGDDKNILLNCGELGLQIFRI